MITLHTWNTPNGQKPAIMLEELGLNYEIVRVDIGKGDQHLPGFRAIIPNGKIPALVDGERTMFESGAILMYLAEKRGQFRPALRAWVGTIDDRPAVQSALARLKPND